MTEQNSSVRLRPWAIARSALADSFGRPIACLRQHAALLALTLFFEVIDRWVIGVALHEEQWGLYLDQRWILKFTLVSYGSAITSLYIYRFLALGKSFSLSTFAPPLRRFAAAFAYVATLHLSTMAVLPLFGVAVWPMTMSFSNWPLIGAALGVLWAILVCIVLCRTGPAFLLIALDHKGANFAESWTITRGHVWRLSLTILWCFLPALLAGMLLSVGMTLAGIDSEGTIADVLTAVANVVLMTLTCPALGVVGIEVYRQLARPTAIV